jgi:carboxypeptidase family protein
MWQVGCATHFPHTAVLPAGHALHSELINGNCPWTVHSVLFRTEAREDKSMRRALLFPTILLLALVSARGVSAAPQSSGSATLSGVVLGPDDKPVAHASVSYQSSGGNAPHAVHTDSRGHFTITKLKADNYDLRASGKGVFSEWEKNLNLRPRQTKNVTLRLIYAKEIPKAYVKSKPKP